MESWDWCYLADSANMHRELQVDSTKRTGNYSRTNQRPRNLLQPITIPGALGGVRQVAPIPTFHGLIRSVQTFQNSPKDIFPGCTAAPGHGQMRSISLTIMTVVRSLINKHRTAFSSRHGGRINIGEKSDNRIIVDNEGYAAGGEWNDKKTRTA